MVKRPSLTQASTRAAAAEALAALAGGTVAAAPLPTALVAPAPHAGDRLRLDQIEPSPLNPRKSFDPDGIAELAASIAAQGLLQNLVVRPGSEPGRYSLIAGERRLRALRLLAERGEWEAGAATIPVRVIEADDADHLALALLENLQRQDVNPMEEAEALAQLVALDPTRYAPSQIAKAIGCSVRHIQQRLALVERLAPEAQQAMREGRISVTQARTLTMAPAVRQRELVEEITDYPTVADLREAITAGMVPTTRAIFDITACPANEIVSSEEAHLSYFADKAAFLRRQHAAAIALANELRATEWAWVRVVESGTAEIWTYDHGPASRERGAPAITRYDLADNDRPRAGAIVHYDPMDGRVELHLGLLLREEPPPATNPPAPAVPLTAPDPTRPYTQGHLAHARRRKTRAMQAAVSHPPTAMRLVCLALLGGQEAVHLRATENGAEDDVVAPEAKAVIELLAGQYLANVTQTGLAFDRWRGVYGLYRDEPAIWAGLIAMPDAEIERLFCALVALRIGTFTDLMPRAGDPPVALAIGESLGLIGTEFDAGLALDPADLDGIRKDQLVKLMREAGIPGEYPDKLADLRAYFCAMAPAGYVLPTLRFRPEEKDER